MTYVNKQLIETGVLLCYELTSLQMASNAYHKKYTKRGTYLYELQDNLEGINLSIQKSWWNSIKTLNFEIGSIYDLRFV